MNKTVPFDIESQIAYLTEKIKEYKKSSENNFKKSMIANIVVICLIPFFLVPVLIPYSIGLGFNESGKKDKKIMEEYKDQLRTLLYDNGLGYMLND